jgi:dCMP deaminase
MTSLSKWDTRFLEMSQHISDWSKDPGTKVGAVIVNPDGKIMSTGYNGLPKGMDDRRLHDRDFKLRHVVHAEMNAIFNSDTHVRGCTLYISHPPCPECAKLIRAAGIMNVFWIHDEEFAKRWGSDAAESVFEEAGVTFTKDSSLHN